MNTHSRTVALVTLFVIGLAGASLGGCGVRMAAPAYDREAIVRGLDEHESLKLDRLIAEYHAMDDALDEEEHAAKKQRIRDAVIDVGMLRIDHDFAVQVESLTRFRSAFDTGADLGTLAASTAATLVTPAGTKSALSALAGSIAATRLSVDRNVFYDRSVPMLVQQMRADRELAAADLLWGATLGVDEYPLAAALRDLDRYAFAGTIDGAIAGLQEAAAENQRRARRVSRQLRGANAAGPAERGE